MSIEMELWTATYLSKVILNKSVTKEMANKAFEYSCKCCCNRGLNITCDKCQIKMVHDITISIFDDFSQKENPLS